ncbi:head-tail connector protein [Ochrobactrum sp. EDr1-4]|uniref:head-tail connector protein n=1 Tax=Ochrobactrum sp. EDr1-4 TaxID=3368622 RepID=UPI003BA05B13
MDSQVRVIEPPQPIVTLEEAKRHLIVDFDDDDELIRSLLLAATSWIDGPTGWLGCALGVQTLELCVADFYSLACQQGIIPLPYPPIVEIVSITYRDPAGASIVMPASEYEATLGGVRPLHNGWPTAEGTADSVRIRYKVGWQRPDPVDSSKLISDAPQAIRTAIMMLVAQWYAVREAATTEGSVNKMPFAVEALLQPYRIYR